MYPSDLKYTKDHEWIRAEGGVYTAGITAFAAEQLGDVTFVELPKPGAKAAQGDAIAAVESVKAASDVYAPAGGTVCAANDELASAPELVNQDPYGRGWFFKLDNVDAAELDSLLSAAEYEAHVNAQADA